MKSRDEIIDLLKKSKISKTKILQFIKDSETPRKVNGGSNLFRRASIILQGYTLNDILENEYDSFYKFATNHFFVENIDGLILAKKCLSDPKYLIPFNQLYNDTGILNISVKSPYTQQTIPKIIKELEENLKSQISAYKTDYRNLNKRRTI